MFWFFFPHRHRARKLKMTFRWDQREATGDHMQFHFAPGQKATVIGNPVTATGAPSQASLSNVVYTSSDPTIFTVAPDPSTVNGAIVTAVAGGTATLNETALATEPDGTTTETISGAATVIVVAPVPPAASLALTFGIPA
jgi:hypothetical protein